MAITTRTVTEACEGAREGALVLARASTATKDSVLTRVAALLREHGSSLLPVGVTSVEGTFEAGDAVDVVSDDAPVGKGIVNYSAGELSRIKGMKSAEVQELMPHAAEEVVHRDFFVLS